MTNRNPQPRRYAGALGNAVILSDPDLPGGPPEGSIIGCVKETLRAGSFTEGTVLLQGGVRFRVWGEGPGQRFIACR